jgi:hypothetical protein
VTVWNKNPQEKWKAEDDIQLLQASTWTKSGAFCWFCDDFCFGRAHSFPSLKSIQILIPVLNQCKSIHENAKKNMYGMGFTALLDRNFDENTNKFGHRGKKIVVQQTKKGWRHFFAGMGHAGCRLKSDPLFANRFDHSGIIDICI